MSYSTIKRYQYVVSEPAPGNGETRLREISFDYLRHVLKPLGVQFRRVYGSKYEDEPLERIIEDHGSAKHRWQGTPGLIVPRNCDVPMIDLAARGARGLHQVLIHCSSAQLERFPEKSLRKPIGLLDVESDVKKIFRKNSTRLESDPVQFYGTKYNPWEFDDYVFHLPYFSRIEAIDCTAAGNDGEVCCARPKKLQGTGSTRTTPTPSILEAKGQPLGKGGDSHGFCFVRRAVTICVDGRLEEMDERTADIKEQETQHKNMQSLSSHWCALLIDPDHLFDLDRNEDFLNGKLPPSARNPLRPSQKAWKNNQSADFFQTRLIEMALSSISDQWVESVSIIEEECDLFKKQVRENMRQPAYWRREVNQDVLEAHKIGAGLGTLEQSIKDIIGDYENEAMDRGVWRKFRAARPRKRMRKLQENLTPFERWKDGRPPEDEKPKRQEVNKLKHIMWELCDVYRHRLFSVQARLRAKKEEMNDLRELLINLSQTRASLYANQLGDHVKWLTYFSIIFLPLGFCTSVWSMNYDLHPKAVFIVAICLSTLATIVLLVFLRWQHHSESVNHRS